MSSVWALGIGVLETEKGNVCKWITWYRLLERPSCVKVPDDSKPCDTASDLEGRLDKVVHVHHYHVWLSGSPAACESSANEIA